MWDRLRFTLYLMAFCFKWMADFYWVLSDNGFEFDEIKGRVNLIKVLFVSNLNGMGY